MKLDNYNFFYSTKEGIFFMIPKYYTNGSCIAKVLVKNINDSIEAMEHIAGKTLEVYNDEILESRRYRRMWLFWVKTEKPNNNLVLKLGEDWTMHEWIK